MIFNRKQKDKVVRFQVEITESFLKELETLQEKGGLSTKKELLNNAFTLLKWAATQKELGYSIVCVDEFGEIRKELQLPFLEQVAMTQKYMHEDDTEDNEDNGSNLPQKEKTIAAKV